LPDSVPTRLPRGGKEGCIPARNSPYRQPLCYSRVLMVEDILSAELISEGLGTRIIGRHVLYYPSVTSTNELAKKETVRGAPEGTVIAATEQTRGRGRLKRSWLTPEGNIAVSVILYPDTAVLRSLIMMTSLAVANSIEAVTGLATQIKWPNDVLIDGRKVCGILIETDVRREKMNSAIIGIGINVNIGMKELSGVQTVATSLSIETGGNVSRLRVVRELLAGMDNLYCSVTSGGSVFEEWRDRLVTLGQEVRVTAGDTVYEGTAESVDGDGSLRVRTPDGVLNTVIAGDVTLRK
jgi:BirA family biotin operon repressor/biotin-[acetyl-CoA-carboxylase] ligase